MTGPFSWQAAGPMLAVEIQGTEKTLRSGPSYRVGRDPQSDFVIDDIRVSWNHAVLWTEGGAWFAEDCGSTNGTFVASRQIDRFEITDDCVLHFGSRDDGPAMSCSLYRPGRSEWPSVDRRPSKVMRAPARALRIGRAEDNDIVLADLTMSIDNILAIAGASSLAPERDMTFVTDTVAGFMAAAITPGIDGMTLNLGTGETHSVGWFAERLLRLMGTTKPIVQDQQRMRPELSEVRKLVSDNRLARERIHWTPRVSLDDGLMQAIKFVTANRDHFRSDGYVR
jgi:hypothetical protein